MANIINYLKKVQPVYRRSSNRTKIIVIVLLVVGITGFFVLRHAINEAEAVNAVLESQADQLEQENADLQENIDNLDTVQGVEQIAQDELGLVSPDTVLIQPGSE